MKKLFFIVLFIATNCLSQEIALLKYNGGGDWYANPTSLPNLIKYSNQTINTTLKSKPATVEPSSPDLLSYPFVHMTGHGNVVFSPADQNNLRNYMMSGGFLHIDDNYGMDEFIRKAARDYPFHLHEDDWSYVAGKIDSVGIKLNNLTNE